MYRVTCKQCGASGIAEDGNRLQQAVGCGCCTQPHNHDLAANACRGVGPDDLSQQHPGAACGHPVSGQACNVLTALGEDCPGGHCFPGVEGCTACRPVTADFIGTIGMQPVGGRSGGFGPGFFGSQLMMLRMWFVWRLASLAANMTDRNTGGNNFVNWLLQAIFCLTATTTYTPGTGGPAAKVVTPPFLLRLMSTAGSNTSNGTQLTATGYTAGGNTMGSPAFGTPAAGVIASSNAVSWTAGAAWAAVLAIEIWDSASTALRWLQGAITSVTLANGNTLNFPAGSITADASQW